MTQFTSFVAVEEKVVNRDGKPVRVDVPVELPEGVSKLAIQQDDEPPPAKRISGLSNSAYIMTPSVSGGQGSGSGNYSRAPFPKPTPKIVSSGVVNGKAVNIPKPAYPSAAKAVKASGSVAVQVTIDENGNVISASSVSGHPLLRASAEAAAKGAKFAPTMLSGKPVKTTGVMVYNFTDENNPATAQYYGGNQPKDFVPAKVTKTEQKLHFWLYQIVERLQKGETKPTEYEPLFVKDGKANISITLSAKTPEVLRKLNELSFEFESPSETGLIGWITIEKLAQLAEIEEVKLILPEIK